MGKIGINVAVRIHSGKLEELKSVANRCVGTVREKDAGTSQCIPSAELGDQRALS
jgi:hypothetical protein